MSTHVAAEKESTLSELIDRALDGEEVVVTRDGEPVVELKPVRRRKGRQKTKPQMTEAEQQFLDAVRAIPSEVRAAAGAEISKMRDEEWER